ncbi:MAG: M48 family metalloprotease [Calditrichaeota bacterium]|nr:M48 family metalloprotease [Calditrichota bacterium]
MTANFQQNKSENHFKIQLILFLMLTFIFVNTGFSTQKVKAGIILREGPGNFYPMLKVLAENTEVDVLERNAGWLKVKLPDNETGWISSNALISSSSTQKPIYTVYKDSLNKQTVGINRTAVGAMIKGLQLDISVTTDVGNAFEPIPGINQSSVHSFRNGFVTNELGRSASSMEIANSIITEYLAITPVLTGQLVKSWGGRVRHVEPYCNQVLLWMADRAGATNVLPQAFVAERGNNAICLPGGWIVIGGDLLKQIQDESELAGVIGHELAHAVFQHGEQSLKKQRHRIAADDVFSELDAETGFENDEETKELEDFASEVSRMINRKHSIDIELTADSAATVWLARAGYDPDGLKRFLKRLNEEFSGSMTGRGGISLAWLNTGDELDARIKKLEKQTKKLKKKVKNPQQYKERFTRNTR